MSTTQQTLIGIPAIQVQQQVKACLTRLTRLHSQAPGHEFSDDELEQAMVWLRAWVKRNVDEA